MYKVLADQVKIQHTPLTQHEPNHADWHGPIPSGYSPMEDQRELVLFLLRSSSLPPAHTANRPSVLTVAAVGQCPLWPTWRRCESE